MWVLSRSVSLSLSPWGETSPSTERCERRASLASLALGDELTGWRSLALVYMLGNS